MDETAALLLVDIVGSTQLTQELGEPAATQLWTRHDRVARDLLHSLGGFEIDKTDGFLILFEDAVTAARFAGRYHESLRSLDPPLRARAALHVSRVSRRLTPDVDVARGAKQLDVDGLPKAVVARVISVAGAGQTLTTEAAADELPPSSLIALGHWHMRGIHEPLKLFELVLGDGNVEIAVDSEKAYRVAKRGETWIPMREVAHSLPGEVASFVGRRPVLLALQQRLEAGARLVTLHGPGGIGKTRLALRAAWSGLGSYAGGVWFCDLSAATSFDGVLHAVASGLRLPPSESADPLRSVRDALVGRGRCLLVLDNFEQVATHASATIGRWLAETIDTQILVTSRVALKVPGEELQGVDSLSEAEALELLSQRGRGVRSQFRIEPAELSEATRLVTLLDCLPLAIELAASRLSAVSLGQILERMSQRFRVLSGASGRQGRHSALWTTLEWSWDLLSAQERRAFVVVSVFEAGFTLPAFEAIVAATVNDDDHWPVDLLGALVDKSLVRRSPNGRYEMLYSIREFATKRLTEMGPNEAATARLRHAEYFGSIDPTISRRHAAIEIENLVAAARYSWQAGHLPLLVSLLDLAWLGLQIVGPFRVALGLAELVLQADHGSPALHAMACYVAGSARKMMGDALRGEDLLRSAVASSAADPNPRVRILSLCALYDCLVDRGDFDAALGYIEAAERLAIELASDPLRLLCMNSKAAHHHQSGDLEAAWLLYESALALARHIDDKRWQGGILGNLGNICQAQGDLERAADLYLESLQLSVSEGDRRWAVNTRCNLGLLRHELGRSDDALNLLQEALVEAEALGSLYAASVIECNLGIVQAANNHRAEAVACFTRFRERAQRLGNAALLSVANGYLAVASARKGSGEVARTLMQAAVEFAGGIDASAATVLAAQRAELAFLLHDENAEQLLLSSEALASGGAVTFEVASALATARACGRAARSDNS